ncbi:MAG: hypothetical protein DMD97_27735 [Candidatus Rokuibacteriota bacterium]|nr:MAG: hypothetical protein DMD97_27735 [Candidatus Rokubacteria bacterium]
MWVFGPPMLPATPAPSLARVRAVDGVALTVSDAERAAEFYTRVLFFEKMSDYELPGPDSRVRIVRMRLGDELMELIEDPAAGRSLQRVAIVVNDIEQAYLWLRRHRVQPVSSPQADWNPETAGIRTVHFNDPDGHPLELVEFPADKGADRWRRPTDRIFLGIDHSAAVDAELREAALSPAGHTEAGHRVP